MVNLNPCMLNRKPYRDKNGVMRCRSHNQCCRVTDKRPHNQPCNLTKQPMGDPMRLNGQVIAGKKAKAKPVQVEKKPHKRAAH